VQLLGHADISLQDSFYYLTYPLNPESLNLSTVLDHPMLSRMWAAHVRREMSAENLNFYRATRAFQHWVTQCE
jgi:hypothetical protein